MVLRSLRALEVAQKIEESNELGAVVEAGTGAYLRAATRRDYERACIERARVRGSVACWREGGRVVTVRGRP